MINMGEPLKDKGTEGIEFVNFIIDLFKNQAEILNKEEGVEASLNEEAVKEMQKKGKEMLGNTKVYDDKEIKSAVEWLKETINKNQIDDIYINEELSLFEVIDQAFPDLQERAKDETKTNFNQRSTK